MMKNKHNESSGVKSVEAILASIETFLSKYSPSTLTSSFYSTLESGERKWHAELEVTKYRMSRTKNVELKYSYKGHGPSIAHAFDEIAKKVAHEYELDMTLFSIS